MFQRLKGAIDSRIAEEQARQRQAALSAPSVSSPARRSANRNGAPPRTSSRQREKQETPGDEKGPDPSEFAIGDDESAVPSRVNTPKPLQVVGEETKIEEGAEQNGDGKNEPATDVAERAEERQGPDTTNTAQLAAAKTFELPTEVRVRLRKLDRLESKYQELLRAYKTAHARIQTIEPFETSLRENTPLTSINDPGAFVEYLNQANLKSDMVLDELKRVSADRDEYKKRCEESEKITAGLQAEATTLKEQNEQVTQTQVVAGAAGRSSIEVKTDDKPTSEPSSSAKSPALSTSSRIPSFSLFSPKSQAKSPPPKESSEEFFSYDSELPRLESELQDRQAEVEELKKQLSNLKGDLSVARESTQSMVESLETATRELHSLRDAKDKFEGTKSKMQMTIEDLQARADKADELADKLQRQINELQADRDESDRILKESESRTDSLSQQLEQSSEALTQSNKLSDQLNERLGQKDASVKDLEDTLAMYKSAERQEVSKRSEEDASSEKRMVKMQDIMDALKTQLKSAETTVAELKQDVAKNKTDFENRPSTKVLGFLDDEPERSFPKLNSRDDVIQYLAEKFELTKRTESSSAEKSSEANLEAAPVSSTISGASKKKNKKKKKAKATTGDTGNVEHEMPVKVTEDLAEADEENANVTMPVSNASAVLLEKEIADLKFEMESKNASIDRLSEKLKDQEALQEEIEILRDDLLHQGEEHVEAKGKLKNARSEQEQLETKIESLQTELVEVRKRIARGVDSEKQHSELLQQFEDLKIKAGGLQTDLAAAEALASARFRDLTELRDVLGKAQPELRSLRTEVAELRSTKDDLKSKSGELSRLEARHDDVKSEMKGMSLRLSEKEVEIKELNGKIEQESNERKKAEEETRTAKDDLRYAESRRLEVLEQKSRLEKDLARMRDEAAQLRNRMQEIEDDAAGHQKQVSVLREEVDLKAKLHSTSQSLVQSLRDQTHELSTQSREASSKAESLEEELAEAQRLLSERTREGQTMRMLLSQAETGTESRLREMRERMESAIEERDRVEDEAGVSQRRMTREVEEARNRLRDMQRSVRVLEEEKEEWDGRTRDWKRRREELEGASERASAEIAEVKAAMAGLKEALDLAEGQVRSLEEQRANLRKDIEEGRDRVEKLTKSNKTLTDEMKSLQQHVPKKGGVRPGIVAGSESGVQSSRSSFESTAASSRSPVPSAAKQPRSDTPMGPNTGTVDYIYLKNVLLQFLEQRDKNHQKQLIPVLGMLLHFDRKDEQKWVAAISAR